MDLKTLRAQFVCALLQGSQKEVLANWVGACALRTAVDSLNIYRQNRLARVAKVLQETYPVCKAIVGELYFKQLCYHYANTVQSADPDLTFYGKDFPLFLRSERYKQRLDYLPDVAQLEWAYFKVLNSGEVLPLATATLAEVPLERQSQIKFRLGFSHSLLSSSYPILEIWRQHRIDPNFKAISLDRGGSRLLVYCYGWEVRVASLCPQAFLLLSCFDKGMTFEEAWLCCEQTFPKIELTALFFKAVKKGWINEFYL